MTAYAPYQMPAQVERPGLQLSDEERDKLQEIHELINLLFKELPITPHQAARHYAMLTAPAVPYTYSLFRVP